ncbi:MAG: hypothetical protein IJ523_02330 [Succinivibrionaceae bacterium]|nr:hypothetical protein [Succinivibrionaceae bacterium]
MRSFFALALLGIGLLCASAAHAAKETDWVVMVYIGADNNLEMSAYVDMLEIESAKPDNAEVLVLIDRSRGNFQGWRNWYGARLYRMVRGRAIPDYKSFIGSSVNDLPADISSEVLSDIGEINSSDPRFLKDFIKYVASNYKGKRYALVAWDHGGGIHGMLEDDGTGAMHLMSNRQFSAAVAEGVQLLPRRKFDLMVMDMCLMGMLDFLYDVRNYADYVVASPPNAPGVGSDYRIMMDLLARRDLGVEDIGKGIVDANIDVYNNITDEAGSFSLYRSGAIEPVADALKELSGTLAAKARKDPFLLTRQIGLSAHFGGQLGYDDRQLGKGAVSSVDLLDFAARLEASDKAYGPYVARLKKALKDFVVYTNASRRNAVSTGVSLYLPAFRSNVADGYYETEFSKRSGIAHFLLNLYKHQEIGTSTEPSITNVEFGTAEPKKNSDLSDPKNFDIVPSTVIRPMARNVVRFDVNGENIMWVKFAEQETTNTPGRLRVNSYNLLLDALKPTRLKDEQLQNNINDVMPEFNNGTTTFLREVVAQRFVLTNGREIAPMSLIRDGLDLSQFAIRGLFNSPSVGQEIQATAVVDANTRILYQVLDSSGKSVSLAGDWYFRPEVRYEMLDQNGNQIAQTEYSQPVYGHGLSAPLYVLMSNLESGSKMLVSYTASTMDGKKAYAFTDMLTVENSKRQVDLIAGTYSRIGELAGRYAVGEYASYQRTGLDLVPLPQIMTLEMIEQFTPSLAKFKWDIDGKIGGEALMLMSPDRQGLTPPLLLVFNGEAGLQSELYGSFELFISGNGPDRSVFLVRLGTGERMGLFPLQNLTREALEGYWVSDRSRWHFSGDLVQGEMKEQKTGSSVKSEGRYVIRDNVIEIQGKQPGDSLKLYALMDRPNSRLVMIMPMEKPILFPMKRAVDADGRTLESVRKEMMGRWKDSKGEYYLEVAPIANTAYLRFRFSNAGKTAEAVVSVSGNRLLMSYAGGAKVKAEYVVDKSSLQLDFDKSGKFSFLKQ